MPAAEVWKGIFFSQYNPYQYNGDLTVYLSFDPRTPKNYPTQATINFKGYYSYGYPIRAEAQVTPNRITLTFGNDQIVLDIVKQDYKFIRGNYYSETLNDAGVFDLNRENIRY